MLVRVFDNFLGDFDIFLKRLVRGVNHHAGKTFINALFAQLEGVTVIQMNGNRNIREADGGLDEFLEINRIGVGTCALGNLENERSFFFFASLDDGLDQLHVVHVERAESVFAFERLGEQVFGMCQWHKLFGFEDRPMLGWS